MNSLVYISEKGNPVTNSLIMAEQFGIPHENIMRTIRGIVTTGKNAANYFETELENGQGNVFIMNRKGYMLLCMGMPHTYAAINIRFIGAFDQAALNTRINNAATQITAEPKKQYTTSVIARQMGITAQELNKELLKRGIIYPVNKKGNLFEVSQKYREQGFGRLKSRTLKQVDSNKTFTSYTLYWTEKGISYITNLLTSSVTQKELSL